jgi:hypothetical protein
MICNKPFAVSIVAQWKHVLSLYLIHVLAVSTLTPKLEGYPFSIIRDCCISWSCSTQFATRGRAMPFGKLEIRDAVLWEYFG